MGFCFVTSSFVILLGGSTGRTVINSAPAQSPVRLPATLLQQSFTMKILFKLSGVLKILFLINIPLLKFYQSYLFRNTKKTGAFENLNFDLQFPWYIYLFALTILGCFLLNIIVINLYAFRPYSKLSKYFHRLTLARLIYTIEIILLVSFLIISYSRIADAYATRDYGMWGDLLKPFVDTESANKLQRIDKLTAFNFILPVVSSFIIAVTFWRLRTNNQDNCIGTNINEH